MYYLFITWAYFDGVVFDLFALNVYQKYKLYKYVVYHDTWFYRQFYNNINKWCHI